MNKISNRIQKLPASATLAMAAKARELKSEGIDIIGLSLGEPDFNTPEFIKKAAIQAVEDNYNSYTPVDGYQDLKESIQQSYCEIKGTENTQTPIENISYINQLANSLLKEPQRNKIHYQTNAKAIILYFFEFCDIGKKTQDEEAQSPSLFD